MNRREFLVRIGGTMVAVPMVLEAISCGDSNKTAGPNGNEWTQTSSSAQGHTHTILFVCSGLATHAGVAYTSSSVGHTHDVTLDATQMNTIIAGGSVTKTSTTNSGHSHDWVIQKPAGTC